MYTSRPIKMYKCQIKLKTNISTTKEGSQIEEKEERLCGGMGIKKRALVSAHVNY